MERTQGYSGTFIGVERWREHKDRGVHSLEWKDGENTRIQWYTHRS